MPKVTHFGLSADDPQRAIDFTRKCSTVSLKYRRPHGILADRGRPGVGSWIGGGLAPRTRADEGTLNNIGVASLDKTLPLIVDNGGEVVRGKSAVPGVGWLAYCRDTEGNEFGVMELDPDAD